jgi:hypothetical protein
MPARRSSLLFRLANLSSRRATKSFVSIAYLTSPVIRLALAFFEANFSVRSAAELPAPDAFARIFLHG